MTADSDERAQTMRERTSRLIGQGDRDVTQPVSSTHDSGTSGVVNLHTSELREVNDQVPVGATEAVACV